MYTPLEFSGEGSLSLSLYPLPFLSHATLSPSFSLPPSILPPPPSLSLSLSLSPSLFPSLSLSIYLSIYLYPSIYLSVYQNYKYLILNKKYSLFCQFLYFETIIKIIGYFEIAYFQFIKYCKIWISLLNFVLYK